MDGEPEMVSRACRDRLPQQRERAARGEGCWEDWQGRDSPQGDSED